MKNYSHTPLIVAGTIFALMALMHLLRLVYQFEVIISGTTIPMWFSIVSFIIASVLSIWMFRASR